MTKTLVEAAISYVLVLGVIGMVFAGCSKESGQPRSISTELTCESGSVQLKRYGSEVSALPADLLGLCEKAIASPAGAGPKVYRPDPADRNVLIAPWHPAATPPGGTK